MPKCKICMTEETRFGTEAELDAHFAEKHPKPPPTPCPESMKHVQELMVDSMMPKGRREPRSDLEREAMRRGDEIMRKWDTEIVNCLLTVLVEHGYSIVEFICEDCKEGYLMAKHSLDKRRKKGKPYWNMAMDGAIHSCDYYISDELADEIDELDFWRMDKDRFPTHANDICRQCGRELIEWHVNGNHKLSCSEGDGWQHKIAAPIEMLRKYAPPPQEV